MKFGRIASNIPEGCSGTVASTVYLRFGRKDFVIVSDPAQPLKRKYGPLWVSHKNHSVDILVDK